MLNAVLDSPGFEAVFCFTMFSIFKKNKRVIDHESIIKNWNNTGTPFEIMPNEAIKNTKDSGNFFKLESERLNELVKSNLTFYIKQVMDNIKYDSERGLGRVFLDENAGFCSQCIIEYLENLGYKIIDENGKKYCSWLD